MSKTSDLKELIELLELREAKELLFKKEEKKPDPKNKLSTTQVWILLVLMYPILGPAYVAFLKLSWLSMQRILQ